tara:strand:- start:3022 stop:3201 length:180 start_codon:yes stop_codon:yes gene_type:complete
VKVIGIYAFSCTLPETSSRGPWRPSRPAHARGARMQASPSWAGPSAAQVLALHKPGNLD